jgi:hypothetical protein
VLLITAYTHANILQHSHAFGEIPGSITHTPDLQQHITLTLSTVCLTCFKLTSSHCCWMLQSALEGFIIEDWGENVATGLLWQEVEEGVRGERDVAWQPVLLEEEGHSSSSIGRGTGGGGAPIGLEGALQDLCRAARVS